MKNNMTAGILALVTIACGGADQSNLRNQDLTGGPFASTAHTITSAEAEARATGIASGQVIETKQRMERGISVFEVHVRMTSGASIEIAIAEDSGQVVKIESEAGPFDYELAPGAGFISLADAIEIAQQLHAGATLSHYELELDDGLRWKYELDVVADAIAYQIEVDAQSGAVLEDSLESEANEDAWDDNGGQGEVEPGDDNGGHGADG